MRGTTMYFVKQLAVIAATITVIAAAAIGSAAALVAIFNL